MIALAEAKQYLRIDHDAEDSAIEALLGRARAIVFDYLKHDAVVRLNAINYPWPNTPQFGWATYPVLDADGSVIGETTESNAFGEMLGYASSTIDAAILLVLGELYGNRDSSADPLSPAVRALLERQRSPAIA